MSAKSETRYAKSGDLNIAYQVVGAGDIDLVIVPGWVSHVEHAWEEPSIGGFLRRITSFSRLILLDRRGTGMSDPVLHLPTLEERMDDVRAVMDAAGSERAALFGISEGGPMCTLFAATYPERALALILFGTYATGSLCDQAAGWPGDAESFEGFLTLLDDNWGKGVSARTFAPSLADDEAFVRRWGRYERLSISPGAARRLLKTAMLTDVSAVLSTITVPTLVIHRTGDGAIPIAQGRHLAENIPGAKFVELPGVDHFGWVGDSESILGEVEEFVTGTRSGRAADRLLATVMFTDIVDSSGWVTRLGDQQWHDVLERYYALVGGEVERFRGRAISTAGDGYFSIFDGPARAVHCAAQVRQAVRNLGMAVRQGLHTGECEVIGDDVGGIAVHVGARISSKAGPEEILVSQTVKDLVVGSDLRFRERGEHVLRGVPGEWKLFAADL